MALTPEEEAAALRIPSYNQSPLNPTSNPGGIGRGGSSNFFAALRDFTALGKGVVRVATETLASISGTAARFEAAVAAIKAGPVTSVNGQSGAVVVDLPRVLAPGNLSPASGATAVLSGGALSLAVSAFSSLYGGAQKSRRARISTTPDFAAVVWDSGVVVGANLFVTLANAQATLTGGATYYWQLQQTDGQDFTSDWSAPTAFVFPRAPSAPTMTTPVDAATGQGANNTAIAFAASDYAHPNGVARARRVFEISATANFASIVATVVSAGGLSTASLAAPRDVLQPDTRYYVRCRDTDANGGTNTSAATTFRTVTAFRPNPGDPYLGGFYVGQINDNGKIWDLIVAPKSGGQSSFLVWKESGFLFSTYSRTNGAGSTASIASTGTTTAYAALFCDRLTAGGYDDWYLPGLDELELAYRVLKPGTTQNQTGYSEVQGDKGFGYNPNSVPGGAAYTGSSPSQTTAAAFRAGGAEAFDERLYWSSTETSENAAQGQRFDDGYQWNFGKNVSALVRAFRRVAA